MLTDQPLAAAITPPAAIHAPSDVTREERFVTLLLVARLVTEEGDELCRVRNISTGGMMLETSAPLTVGKPVRIELRNLQAVTGKIVWLREIKAGVQFDAPADVAQILNAATSKEKGARQPRSPRFTTECPVQLRWQGQAGRATLDDLSQSGAKFRTNELFAIDDQVTLTIAGLEPKRAAVRWLRDGEVGVVFLQPLPFPELDRWLQDRTTRYSDRA